MRVVASCLMLIAIGSTSGAQKTKAPPPSPLKTGIALFDAEKLDQAKATLTPLAAAGDPDAMYYLGRIAIEQTKGDSAVSWLEQAIVKNGRSSLYYQWLGSAYSVQLSSANMFTQMSLAPKLKQVMERAVELDSSNVDARVNLTAFYLQAPAAMGGGIDKAREQVAVIARLNPYQGRLQDAAIAQNQRDTVAVERIYRDLATAYPDSSQPTVSLALAYVTLKRYEDAYSLLEDRLAKHPNEPAALYQVGRVAAVSGLHLDRGQAALNRYLKMPHHRGNPTLAAAHWRLGMVLEAKGDKKTAKSEYEAALVLDPNLAGAKASLEKVK